VIRCLSCESTIDAARDLLARRFLLGEEQRGVLSPQDLLLATTQEAVLATEVPEIDYSRSVFQYLYGCPSCLSLVQADRPARADDVVPGRLRLAVPGSVAVRAIRRLSSAVAGGRARDELRALQADPLRRYVLRLPQVFRAVRPAFGEDAVLVADVTPTLSREEHAGPLGVYWDEGPSVSRDRPRLRRLVKRTVCSFERWAEELPLNWGKVEMFNEPLLDAGIVASFSRETRLPVIGEDPAALRVAAPRVKPPAGIVRELTPAGGYAVTLDLVRPAT
jgi:hypothetical protein